VFGESPDQWRRKRNVFDRIYRIDRIGIWLVGDDGAL
jgi:hypothetical protein